MTNRDRTSGVASAMSILGNGHAEVEWIDTYLQGACTAKLADNEWLAKLPKNDKIVQLHEQSHVKWSGWESTGIVANLTQRGKALYAVIEDSRIDSIGADYYRRPLFKDHGARLAEGTKSQPELVPNVMALAYDLGHLLTELGRDVLAKFGKRLVDVRTSDDPYATARLAWDIDLAYKPDDEMPPQDQPDSGDAKGEGESPDSGDASDSDDSDGSNSGDAEQTSTTSIPDTDNMTDMTDETGDGSGDATSNLDSTDGDANKFESNNVEIMESKGTGVEEVWEALKELMQDYADIQERNADQAVDVASQTHEPAEKLDVSRLADRTNLYDQTELSEHTRIALDGIENKSRNRYSKKGTITSRVWRLNHGYDRVFENKPRRRGKVVIAVDQSASMHCPCSSPTCYRNRNNGGRPSGSWLAWQVSAAISEAAKDAEVYAWAGGGCWAKTADIPAGMQPSHELSRHISDSTPTCGALYDLGVRLDGDTEGAVGVLITDGRADNGPCTTKVAEELHARGVRFVVVVVKWDGDVSYVAGHYPDAVTVVVNKPEDLANLGPALQEVLG